MIGWLCGDSGADPTLLEGQFRVRHLTGLDLGHEIEHPALGNALP